VSESELAVELHNGNRIRLYGADNPDALRGIYLDGVVLDEFADIRPSVWGEVIRPLLADRKGWAVFIGTPRGRNAFYQVWKSALTDPEWFTLMLRASETGLLSESELGSARKTMSEDQYEQEFECSFDAAILNAIFAKYVARAREAGRIGRVPHEPSRLVSVAMDIGQRDATSVWFYQWVKQELHVIDFYENSGQKVPHYASMLRAKPYEYDTIWLPHDSENDHAEADQTYADRFRSMDFKVRVVPRLKLMDGIEAGRLALDRAYIDGERCEQGLEALSHYRWDVNTRTDNATKLPLHDWSCHAADGWRYMALSLKVGERKPKAITYDLRGYI